MKATVTPHDTDFTLTLTPETEEDEIRLKVLGRMSIHRSFHFRCRGFDFMNPNVEFSIYPPPKND